MFTRGTVAAQIELLLVPNADAAWIQVYRPWFERGRGHLERSLVVVPTRGQAHALKQRCLEEGLPLLGIDFLPPGLVRRKWLSLGREVSDPTLADRLARPAAGREFLLLGLRFLLAERSAGLEPDDPAADFWRSLGSDLARALDAHDELLQAGFRAGDFPRAELCELFGELDRWVAEHGGVLAPMQAEAAALTAVPAKAPAVAGRILVAGCGCEAWPEFFNLAALVRRCPRLTVAIPEPEFRGRARLDEHWVDLWQSLLGVEAASLEATESSGCRAVAELWSGSDGRSDDADWIVGRTRADEMALVTDRIAMLLDSGARNIAVVFPSSDAAHLRLVRLLREREIPFSDLLETSGTPAIDLQLLRAVLAFHEQGGRIEALLALWPLLLALGVVREPPGTVRRCVERWFDEHQTHETAACAAALAGESGGPAEELSRVAALLLPAWPERLTLLDARGRIDELARDLPLALPDGWSAFGTFAEQVRDELPRRAVIEALHGFLPVCSPAEAAPGRGTFAPVTLTTRRRAVGMSWSHAILVESNSGVWPERRESPCWLPDAVRHELNVRGRYSLGLLTAEDRASLDRQLCLRLAGDVRTQLVFSAALFGDEDPEVPLAPNAWMERVLVHAGVLDGEDPDRSFLRLAEEVPAASAEHPEAWSRIWHRRRDPAVPFDEYFLSLAAGGRRPARLAARMIERGLQDPAELWFDAVLRVRRVEWKPLVRVRKRALGQLAHRLLAAALRGEPVEGIFRRCPDAVRSTAQLMRARSELRDAWPRDRFRESLLAELGALTEALLGQLRTIESGGFAAVEAPLPRGTLIALGDGVRLEVDGRLDLVRLDRPAWSGAQVDVVDFKTGSDRPLSVGRLARGESLQLGVYLEAMAALGAAGGRVWMVKPDAAPSSLSLEELRPAMAPSWARLRLHLVSGRFGALTPDRTDFSHGYEWPLACTPVRAAVLAAKYAITFGMPAEDPGVSSESSDDV